MASIHQTFLLDRGCPASALGGGMHADNRIDLLNLFLDNEEQDSATFDARTIAQCSCGKDSGAKSHHEKFFTLLLLSGRNFRGGMAVVFDVIHDLLSVLISWDIQTFLLINEHLSNGLFDMVMPIVTTTKYWLPIFVASLGLMVLRGYRARDADGRRLIVCTAMLVLSVAMADQLSHRLLKETIQRPRPYLVLSEVHQLVGSGGGSFPSNHAMNSAIIAMILSAFFPRLRTWWWSYAVLIGFSRVYCGVHYPSDVLGGYVIGILWALLMIHGVRRQWPQLPIGPPPRA
ncbi:MAG: phosphatase PAP2 family protein [Candidatus Kapabacteria bacterium]|nr:phosphatase PAP2 family protein [Candidatus Kapabacteria bacterium]